MFTNLGKVKNHNKTEKISAEINKYELLNNYVDNLIFETKSK
tara:strand:+ start:354 stop:479 length:126 start_codon:yes stop_codon:yes gene_type:complete